MPRKTDHTGELERYEELYRAMAPLRQGDVRRAMASLAVVPRRRSAVRQHAVLEAADTDVYVLADRDFFNTHDAVRRWLGSTSVGHRLTAKVDGDYDVTMTWNGDFFDRFPMSEPPRRPESLLRCRDRQPLRATGSGTLLASARREWVDLYLRPTGQEKLRPLCSLLKRTLFDRRPTAKIVLLKTGTRIRDDSLLSLGEVEDGQSVVEFSDHTEYMLASEFSKVGVPPILRRNLTPKLAILNRLMASQREHTASLGGENTPPDPSTWRFSPMFAFAEIDNKLIARLLKCPAFQADMLDAVGLAGAVQPDGSRFYLRVHAAASGKVNKIYVSAGGTATEIWYESGETQVLPGSARLYRVHPGRGATIELRAKQYTEKDSPIGDYVPRTTYDGWKQLKAVLQGDLGLVAEEMLRRVAVGPADKQWAGHGFLLPARYVTGNAMDLATRYPDGSPVLYLDLRAAAASGCWDDQISSFVLPPFYLSGGWHSSVRVGGIQVNWSKPAPEEAEVAEETSEPRPKRRKKKKAAVKR